MVFGEVDDGFSPGMSAAVTMVNSCQGMAGSKSMERMRPRAMVLRTVAPNHMPGRVMSSTYWALPRTLAGPSLRMGGCLRFGSCLAWRLEYFVFG